MSLEPPKSDNDKIRDRLRTHLVQVIIDAEALYPGIIDEVRRDLIDEQIHQRP
jgi:hypothetical protein